MTVNQEQLQPEDAPHTTPDATAHSPSTLAQLSRRGRTTWERHPSDTARFVIALAVCLTFVAYARTDPQGVQGISSDLVLLFNRLPELVTRVIVGLLQVAALVAPIGAILYFRRGRWAELVLAAGAAVAAGLAAAVLAGVLRNAVPPQVIDEALRPSWVTGSAFPSGSYLAGVAAAVTTIAPTLSVSWRRAAWWTVVLVAAARVITAVETPLNLVASVSLGVAVGSLALMVLGAPSRRPAPASVAAALSTSGLMVMDLTSSAVRSSHGPTYLALDGHHRMFVKVVGRDERDADLLARFVRFLRVKNIAEDRPVSPRLTVEREALNTLMARQADVAAAEVLAVGETDERGAFVALEYLDGTLLSDLTDADFTDAVVAAAFEQLARLHIARIAHRWASIDHLLLQPDGSVALLDFRWAKLSADDADLSRDLAEMLASTAVRVGHERAVAAAAQAFDSAALAASLPLLQPLAVSSTTRHALRDHKQLLADLRTEVQTTAAVEQYEMMEIQRLSLRKVIIFVAFLVLGNLMLGFIANFGDIWAEMKGADFTKVPLMIVFVGISFTGGALSLMGAVNIRLPFFRTTEIMFAQSFLNRFTPANAGGMALRARYLQRSGVDLTVAAGSVGLTSAASGVMQVVMATMFFVWAGSSAEARDSAFNLPSKTTILIIIVIALAILGIVAVTAFGKRIVAKVKPQVITLLKELRVLAKQPTKMILLFGGAFVGKIMAIVMLAQSLRAFGQPVHFAALGAMYITATTIAAAAPTPGGVGAIEAALAAGLTGLGVDPATAVAVVMFFRLISYWFPILPCWIALTHVERSDMI